MKTDIRSESFGALLIESGIDAIVAVGVEREIIVWNKAAENLFDKTHDEVVGRTLEDVLPSVVTDQVLLDAIRSAERGMKSFLPAKSDLRHRRHVETHILPLVSNDEPIGVMLLIRDVSHRIAKEAELHSVNTELQKRLRQVKLSERELSHLTYVATHNIREPIRTVYTTIERLIREEANMLSNNGKASFRRIQSSLNRISLLLEDIVTLTQINITDQPKGMVNMEAIVAEVTKTLEVKISESNAVVTTGELCEIRAHRNQMVLMLQHLVMNAIKFNDTGSPKIFIECTKVMIDGETEPEGFTGEHFLLKLVHNGSAYNIDPKKVFDVVELSGEQMKNSAEVIAIAVKVMEANSGSLLIEKSANGETEIRCYFPA
ncbi:MAG: PAS domain-containing protein [Chitinophagaceae bacterium]|nr:PAS domain-containing protein [Chitinophagaceae bacterium]